MDTPANLLGFWGSEPVIRRLWASEHEDWCEHLLRLGPQDRRDRFAGVVSDAFIRSYCARVDPFSLTLFGAFVDGELRAVGEFAMLSHDAPRRAELAFSVESGWQNRGLGTALFRRLVMHARNRAVSRVYIVSEPGNRRMHRIARKFDMTLSAEYGETAGRMELLGPSYMSVMEEMMEEGMALFRNAPRLPLPGE
ncbi:GNAT family N-acetyltransferase [Aquisalimonas asiatica]|uniref:Acetyltransferase (GNAT) family protein n=1 Tax=Aquisalimonas asiatica TaxID=406100 RepID=A0A1H8V3A6_9GAMM|nr:GNAT family N-acetyltransferase [Aquisalimonas asiatica]SEP09871.1 Acetyltransferase (GNAT) family protein [Aquisalimonas asiatica]